MSIQQENPPIEHTDVLIVGSGISGIGAAYYLQKQHPTKSYVILDGRENSGGTWDLFRYPGIRSDSDLHTFGYEFKPWVNDKSIASADAIRAYIRETADENGINTHIRFQHKVIEAAWSSEKACWMVCIERLDTGAQMRMSCNWFFSAAGYYRYDQGFTPRFEGVEQFKGQVVHPQHWPENLEYGGKRVLVIGSGATAVTIVPAMTDQAAHVTMLQRTPSYILSQPSIDPIAKAMRTLLPEKWAYSLTRSKNITRSRKVWLLCLKYPKTARRLIRWLNKRELPKGYPIDEHFNPPYNPWDQRLCVVPDGDLFKAISTGKASVVTDHIETFTEDGVRLKSGKELVADIIVTATGLNVQLFGGIRLIVDGVPVDLSTKVAFKGLMLNGVPNFAFSIGYTNSSWTLKVGLTCEHFCRILGHMDHHGQAICYPELPDPDMPTRPLLDFGAGYVKRAIDTVPRQGPGAPWLMSMDYREDVKTLREGPVENLYLKFLPRNSNVHSWAPKAHRRMEA